MEFNATIADTCLDDDCLDKHGVGCCTKNAGSNGALVDVEYYTMLNNFGTTDAAEGSMTYKVF